jgi:hypothetical protein
MLTAGRAAGKRPMHRADPFHDSLHRTRPIPAVQPRHSYENVGILYIVPAPDAINSIKSIA